MKVFLRAADSSAARMDFWKILLLFAAAAEAAAAAAVNLTRKVGDDVTLRLGHRLLKPGDMLVWSYGPETGKENVSFSIDIENQGERIQRDQFELDLTTGALTIKNLSAKDSAVYRGQIINGNGTKRIFNLTVKGPDPIQPVQPTAEPQQHENTWIIICVVVLLVLILIGSLIAFRMKKKKLRSAATVV